MQSMEFSAGQRNGHRESNLNKLRGHVRGRKGHVGAPQALAGESTDKKRAQLSNVGKISGFRKSSLTFIYKFWSFDVYSTFLIGTNFPEFQNYNLPRYFH